jgi:membrane associated rhomboid family serine protease
MFTHANISHLIFNMFGILFFGVNLEKAIGSKEFILFYLVCGVLCGVLSFTGYYFTGGYRIFLLGASGAVYAILFAYAVVFPRSIIYIWGLLPIPAPILVLIYTVIEIFSQVFSSSNVAHLTHLFGFLIAWIYFVVRMGIHPIKIWKGKY